VAGSGSITWASTKLAPCHAIVMAVPLPASQTKANTMFFTTTIVGHHNRFFLNWKLKRA